MGDNNRVFSLQLFYRYDGRRKGFPRGIEARAYQVLRISSKSIVLPTFFQTNSVSTAFTTVMKM